MHESWQPATKHVCYVMCASNSCARAGHAVQVKQIAADLGLKGKGDKAYLIELILKIHNKQSYKIR